MRALASRLAVLTLALVTTAPGGPTAGDDDWQAFELSALEQQQEHSGRAYLGFLRVPTLSSGLYSLEAGSEDLQPVHDRDEVYYVIRGRAVLLIGEDSRAVRAGSIVYVKAGVEHRFDDIEENLEVLVFFAAPPKDD